MPTAEESHTEVAVVRPWTSGTAVEVESFGSASGESYKKIIIVGCGELRADGSEFRVLS